MSKRDRLIVVVAAALAVLVLAWLAFVSPERKKAAALVQSVKAAETTLSSARAKLSQSEADERRYQAAYASIVSLGEAVPADQEVPALIYQINHVAGHSHVAFETISAGGSGSSAGVISGFEQLPFTLNFSGSFFDLYHLMQKIQGLTVSSTSGVKVTGRLLTISSLSLSGGGSASGGSSSAPGALLNGTISATAYVLPPGQTLTGGATPSAPAGASPSATSSSPSSPAVVAAP